MSLLNAVSFVVVVLGMQFQDARGALCRNAGREPEAQRIPAYEDNSRQRIGGVDPAPSSGSTTITYPDYPLLNRRCCQLQLDRYHPYEDIVKYIEGNSYRYPYLATSLVIGTTYEGNPIPGIKISNGQEWEVKPAVWIDGGTNAEEWISTSTAVYIIDKFIQNHVNNGRTSRLIDAFDWYIFPVLNPDGYKYSWTMDRMWRKNRSPNYLRRKTKSSQDECTGVDLCANYGVNFGKYFVTKNPCSRYYRGPWAFSEAETQAVRNAIIALNQTIIATFTLHSYGQVMACPYASSFRYPEDYPDLVSVMNKSVEAMNQINGEVYEYGTIAKKVYAMGGTFTDWAYEEAGIKYSFRLELRDKGKNGYVLPEKYIIPTAAETWEGIQVAMEEIGRRFYNTV